MALTRMAPREKEPALPGPRGGASWRRRGRAWDALLGLLVRAGGTSRVASFQEPFLHLRTFVLNWGATAPGQAAQRSGPALLCVSEVPR